MWFQNLRQSTSFQKKGRWCLGLKRLPYSSMIFHPSPWFTKIIHHELGIFSWKRWPGPPKDTIFPRSPWHMLFHTVSELNCLECSGEIGCSTRCKPHELGFQNGVVAWGQTNSWSFKTIPLHLDSSKVLPQESSKNLRGLQVLRMVAGVNNFIKLGAEWPFILREWTETLMPMNPAPAGCRIRNFTSMSYLHLFICLTIVIAMNVKYIYISIYIHICTYTYIYIYMCVCVCVILYMGVRHMPVLTVFFLPQLEMMFAQLGWVGGNRGTTSTAEVWQKEVQQDTASTAEVQ